MPIPGFLSKLLKGGNAAADEEDYAPDTGYGDESLDTTPNPSGAGKAPTLPTARITPTYANASDIAPQGEAPTPVIPSLINDPRMAGRTIKEEFNLRQNDPNREIVYREPFGAERFNYVTNNGTELPHRSWRDALKNIASGALIGASSSPDNPLAGMLSGAATGGIAGAVSPTTGAEMRFNSFRLPQLIQNRQMAQEQALNSAKVNAENMKGRQEEMTALNKNHVKTERGVLDLSTGKIVPGTEPKENPFDIRVLPPGAIGVNGKGETVVKNPVTAKPGSEKQQIKTLVNPNTGLPENVNVLDPQFRSWKPYKEQTEKGFTPGQKRAEEWRNQDAQDKYDASEKAFQDSLASFEAIKDDAKQRGVASNNLKDDENLKNAILYLQQYYPRRVKVKYDKTTGEPSVEEVAGSKPQPPARLRGKSGASGGNNNASLYNPSKYGDLK